MNALDALDEVDLGVAPRADDVWDSVSKSHVDGLHAEVSRRLKKSIRAVVRSESPIAIVVQGERGSGKTHLLSWARQEIFRQGGFFFHMKLVAGRNFWESAVHSMIDGVYRRDDAHISQLQHLLRGLCAVADVDEAVAAAILGGSQLTPDHLDLLVTGIRRKDRQVGNEAAQTVRALTLIAGSGDIAEIGTGYFALNNGEAERRAAWGLSAQARPAQLVLRDLSRLLAMVGPVVFAFDQLDNLRAASTSSIGTASTADNRTAVKMNNDITAGLMELREEARRTLIIVACQPGTWESISRSALKSALDRFEMLPPLTNIPDQDTAAAIISQRLLPAYEAVGFEPPYPTWPIAASAIAEAPQRLTARRLLLAVKGHIEACLSARTVSELRALDGSVQPPQEHPPIDVHPLNELFEKLRDEADDSAPLDRNKEDRLIPGLLAAGLQALTIELGIDSSRVAVETGFGGKKALHARLRFVIDESRESEIHWSFRSNAFRRGDAIQTRLVNAMAEAELAEGLSSRRLTILRNLPYPTNTELVQTLLEFDRKGGHRVPINAADLRTLAALQIVLQQRPPSLHEWLRSERPAGQTDVFAPVAKDLEEYATATRPSLQTSSAVADGERERPLAGTEILIGRTVRGDREFTVATGQLRKHAVVVGAVGSGKTVLIRRLIEQCALHGVSAIVLDPNGDLGRLGDRWPITPKGWTDEHERDAQRYFAETEVKVWTPGINRGRPLAFHSIPDFSSVVSDRDDFSRLLASTVAALAPDAGIRGTTARSTQQRGVLQRALELYVREGGQRLSGLIDILSEPPGEIVNSRTKNLATQMADTLHGIMTTDPLLDEDVEPVDVAALLRPGAGRKSRVSVISFLGLPGDSGPRFVSQLQGALFSWFKAHPTKDPALGGLLVMDEAQNFVPSGRANQSTDSTVGLIRQIRKYGLGVVLGTQAPKGIHNEALGNTANQFIGRLTSPVQIGAAEDMARARNAVLDNVGGLSRGTFYATGEGATFSKTQVPICLSHHAEPLQEHEVVERARR
ncbi:ATPase [Kineosporia sp. NBRC 101677]|uniref:ATP-binding protein n=1 Tax=Kineosporia sp. NBRC 101677 TaxID=3032197 RepID=UPI0024A4C294|nr:ATP-binding protein [Kineosporia sp. NBRC 101677]GLY19901.1 ATPase [Kineosporia sp. NBRC 101677]